MAFCINCGSELIEGAKFCQKCGHPTKLASTGYTQRQQEFAGKLYKCPSCGEIMNSFEINCPACGYELRGAKASSSVRELARRLNEIEATREQKKKSTFKDRLRENQEISKTDAQKIELIRNFAIPNTKEDLHEFLILAESNIELGLYDGSVMPTNSRLALTEAWKAKFEQVYQKAKLVYDYNDPEFKNIENFYKKTQDNIKASKKKPLKDVAIIFGVLFGILFAVCIVTNLQEPGKQREEIARLEAIVIEIEDALENGEYKLALMNAESLVYGRDDDELERKWNIQREYWIDEVISQAAAAGVMLERDQVNESTKEIETSEEDNKRGFFAGFMEGFQSGEEIANENTNGFFEAMSTDRTFEQKNAMENTIEKGTEYSFMLDEWNLYVATAITDNTIKIERWGKHLSEAKTVSYQKDIGTYKINDSANGFAWIDNSRTAFLITMHDDDEMSKAKSVLFTVNINDSEKNKGSNCDNTIVCYSVGADDWTMYRAIPLTDNLMKIEAWCRTFSLGNYHYGYDLCVIDVNSQSTDFEWTDEEHVMFTITLKDGEIFKTPKLMTFTIDDENAKYQTIRQYLESN